jgi:hypothetical protein
VKMVIKRFYEIIHNYMSKNCHVVITNVKQGIAAVLMAD